MSEFIEIDTEYKKRLFRFYGILTIVLVLVAIVVGIPLFRYVDSLRGGDKMFLGETIQYVLICIPIIPALTLIWVGIKTLRDKQYPYKGLKVIRRTKLVTGKKATTTGVLLIFMGVLPILLIIGSIIMTRNINSNFMGNPLGYQPRFFINQ